MAQLLTRFKMPMSGGGPHDMRIVRKNDNTLFLEEAAMDALGEPMWRPGLVKPAKLSIWLDLLFVDGWKRYATTTSDGSKLDTRNVTNLPAGARGIVAAWTTKCSNSHAADEAHHAVYAEDTLPVVGRTLTPLGEGHRMDQVLLGAIAVLNGYPVIWSTDL